MDYAGREPRAPRGAIIRSAMQGLNVLMIGTSTETRGGVATVERLIMEAGRGVSYSHLVTHDDRPLGKHWRFATALLRCLLLPRASFDLAHVHVSNRGSLYRKCILSRVLRWKGIPYVLHAHATDLIMAGEPAPWQAEAQRMLRHAAGLIALSERWAEAYASLPDVRLKVWTLLNPVQLPAARNAHREAATPVSLLFLGRIGERKGAFELLEAMAALERRRPGAARLVMAGDGEVERARALVASAGLAHCVDVRSWAGDLEKARLLASSDVLVLPSRGEGLPMALLEAMAHELAVVTCPVGGIADVVSDRENGLLVPPGDADALGKALLELVEDPALRRRLAARARASMMRHALPEYLRQLEAIYERALAVDEPQVSQPAL